MKNWTYTDDIHNSIKIHNEEFRINTAYDNVFKLINFMENDKINKHEAFFRIIFYPSDYDRFKKLTKEWEMPEYISLINFIMNEYIISSEKSSGKRYSDMQKDSELIFASFYYDYGISLIEKKGKMTWKEFVILYNNLSGNSPLGRLIGMTSRKDSELSLEDRKIKHERRQMLNDDIDVDSQIDSLAKFLKTTAKRDKNVSKQAKSPK